MAEKHGSYEDGNDFWFRRPALLAFALAARTKPEAPHLPNRVGAVIVPDDQKPKGGWGGPGPVSDGG